MIVAFVRTLLFRAPRQTRRARRYDDDFHFVFGLNKIKKKDACDNMQMAHAYTMLNCISTGAARLSPATTFCVDFGFARLCYSFFLLVLVAYTSCFLCVHMYTGFRTL